MRKRRSAARGAGDTAALMGGLALAPMVMMMRLPLLAAEAKSAGPRQTETLRAVSEKTAAIAEGALGAQLAIAQAAWRFWPEVMAGRLPSLISGAAVARSTEAALRPASRAVTANFKRLSGG